MADMVDFSRFGFDPWEKYESNREYLLKRAGLEEAIRSGEEERELKSQELGLKAVEEARLGKKAKLEQINKQQETSMNKIGVLGSMLANANEENWGEIRKRGLQLLTQDLQMQLQSGIIDQNQFDEQVRFLDESVPEEYNQDFVLSTIRAFTDAGKDQEIETLWTKNKKTGAYTPHPHVSGTAITIPPGEVPVDDFDADKMINAWSGFFKNNPNATDEQISSFARSLKSKADNELQKLTSNMKDYYLAKQDPEYARFLKNKTGNVDKRKFADERKMRTDFLKLPEVKDFALIDSQLQRLDKAMEESKTSNSLVAVDQALITILNKMLDPQSVVRESEYARTPGDLAFINRMRGKIEKLKTGGAGLTDDDREAIARMARSFYNVAKGMYDSQVKYYKWLAEGYGYDPKRVVRLGGANKKTEPPATGKGNIPDLSQPVTKSNKPPIPGAKQAPDGKWYIKKDGGWNEVIVK